jgi:predicted NBD/HSP70 family sugar kinase
VIRRGHRHRLAGAARPEHRHGHQHAEPRLAQLPAARPDRQRVGLPATLDNDANCATYGEWWLGAGRNVDTLVGLTLGTGIGGGIVLNGEIFHGASDAAARSAT